MVLKKCRKEGCEKPLLSKHIDTDRMNRRVQWYRCINGHWESELIDDER